MAHIIAKDKEASSVLTIELGIGFEQIWHLIQQLPDEQRINLLNQLQATLETEKLIKPRTDEDQRRDYVPSQRPKHPNYKKPMVTEEDILKWEAEEFDKEEDLDENLTDEEFVEMLKKI